ncbi:hypothetical protein EX30DRAFT_289127, partial [Ascodesmis nigricans]
GGRIYELVVQQQPQRARMCGFGDKDRRPITPPPCVQLIVRDANTGQELDINEVETTYYVLTVDLWSADGAREVNLVRHSATSPSISTATSSSYPPPPPPVPSHSSMYPPHPQHQQHQQHPQHPQHPQHSPHPQHPHPQHQHPQHPQHPQHTQYPPYNAHGGHLHPPQTVPQQQQNGYPAGGYYSHGHQPHSSQHPRNDSLALPHSAPPAPPAPSGMFSRNLIGSLSASAFKLYDTDNKMGVWFVLQDLSVRTEGAFRLKMNFVNVGKPDGQGLSTGITPVLATAYSDVFHVYAAKKFPGVVPGTLLSKKFAAQGIKIPVRREK